MPNRLQTSVAIIPLLTLLFFILSAFYHGNPGFKLDKTQNGLLISEVDTHFNPVQKGDLIVALHGVSYSEVLGWLLVQSEYSDDPVITFRRDGNEFSIAVKTIPLTINMLIGLIWPRVLLVMSFLGLAFAAGVRAPRSIQTDLFFFMLCGLSTSVAATTASSLGLLVPGTVSFSFLLLAASNWVSFGAWLHFACRFPSGCDLLEKKRWPLVIIYLVPPLTTICLSLVSGGFTTDFWSWLQRYRNLFLPLIIVSAFCKHLWDYQRLTLTQLRNQIKLPLAAYWLTFAPYLFLYLLPNLLIDRPLISFRLIIFFFFALPLAYLAVLLRYGLFEVDRLISRSVAYISITALVIASYSFLLTLLKRWLFGNQILSEELFLIFFIAVVIGFYPAINYLEKLINRRFFRHRPVPSELLHRFSDKISATLSLSGIFETLIEELPGKMNIESAALMMLQEKQSHIYPSQVRFGSIPWLESLLVKKMQNISTLYLPMDPGSAIPQLDQEMDEIRQAGFVLAFPMRTATGLSGIMFIGTKKDRRLFTLDDIHLLASIANQAAIALQNAHRYESLNKSKEQIETLFAQRVQQEKMAIVGEMTATVAHELRNPLGIIHSSAQYLVSGNRSKEVHDEMLTYIIDEVDHLNISISSLLGLVRQKTPQFELVNLETVVPVMIDRWKKSSEHNSEVLISSKIDRYVPAVYADVHQLTQVLLNLIRNSEEMFENGGEVLLKVEGGDGQVIIRVIDNGPGIKENEREQLFHNFYTTKENGLGLGLVVCRQIVNAHNGTIELYNNENGGTEARLLLPLKPLTTSGL